MTNDDSVVNKTIQTFGGHGLLNPILVRAEQDGTFTTLAGTRRVRGLKSDQS